MSTELVLLPKSQYASLLAKKCGTCSSSESTIEPQTEKSPLEQSTNIPSASNGNNIPHATDVLSKSNDGTWGDGGQEDKEGGTTAGHGHHKLGENSSVHHNIVPDSHNSGEVGEKDTGKEELHQQSLNNPSALVGESKKGNSSLLLKFKVNDQKYIRNILSACEKNPDIISWNSEGVIKVRGEEIQGSDIVELLFDTLSDRKNPVGKLIIYQALSDAGVTTKDLKNRNNKAFFNAVNGKKVVKKSTGTCKKRKQMQDEKTENIPPSQISVKNVNSNSPPSKKKNTWIIWK